MFGAKCDIFSVLYEVQVEYEVGAGIIAGVSSKCCAAWVCRVYVHVLWW